MNILTTQVRYYLKDQIFYHLSLFFNVLEELANWQNDGHRIERVFVLQSRVMGDGVRGAPSRE